MNYSALHTISHSKKKVINRSGNRGTSCRLHYKSAIICFPVCMLITLIKKVENLQSADTKMFYLFMNNNDT